MKKKLIIIISAAVAVLAIVIAAIIIIANPNKDCEHEWGNWQIVKEASCAAEGEQKRACQKCDLEEKEAISKIAHIRTDFDIVESFVGNCEEDSKNILECRVCHGQVEEILELATGHSIVSWNFSNETVKEGTTCEYIQTFKGYCSKCNNNVEKVENISKHNYTITIKEEATCISEGIKLLTCECGHEEEISYTNEHAHNLDNGVVNGEITTYTCQNGGCSYTKTAIVLKEQVSATIAKENLSGNSVELQNASIALDATTLAGLGDNDITLGAAILDDDATTDLLNQLSDEQKAQVGDSKIYDFSINGGGSTFDGVVTVTIPYILTSGEDPENIAIWFVNDSGELETIKAVYANGYVTFETNHFSYYTVTRLSPKERCALYGHINLEIKVQATCVSEGYTLNICQRCGESAITNIVKATGHNFDSNIVEATCTANGSASHICLACHFSYTEVIISNGHSYRETERIESTIEQTGLIKYTCEVCGHVKEEIIPKKDAEIEKLTDVEIIKKAFENFNFKNISFKVSNLKLENFSMIDEFNNEFDMYLDLEALELYLGLNDNNELVGSGTFIATHRFAGIENQAECKGYIINNKLYLMAFVSGDLISEEVNLVLDLTNAILISDQYYITTDSEDTNYFDKDDLAQYFGQMLDKEFVSFAELETYLQNILDNFETNMKPIIDNIVNKNSDSFGKVEQTVLSTLFTLNRVGNEYEIVLNINGLNDLYKYLIETNLYDIIKTVVGEKILKNYDLLLNFDVKKLVDFIEERGLVLSDLVAAIDKVLQYVLETEEITLNQLLGDLIPWESDEPFDILKFIESEEIQNLSVKEVLENVFGLDLEVLKDEIDKYLDLFKEMTIAQLAGVDEELISHIEVMLKNITDCVNVKFVANSDFNIYKYNLNLKLELELEYFEVLKEYLGEDSLVDIEFEVLFDNQQVLANSNIYNMISNFQTNIFSKIDFNTYFEETYSDDYRECEYILVDDQIQKVIIYDEYENIEIYIKDFMNPVYMVYSKQCGNVYYVEMEVVVEINDLDGISATTTRNYSFVFDTSKNEIYADYYYDDFEHDYIRNPQADVTSGECLEFSKYAYICSNCGHEYHEVEMNYHDYQYDNIIMNGALCTDGYEYDISCSKCDYTNHIVGNDHDYLVEKIDGAEIGSICGGYFEIESCLCGKEANVDEEMNCEFEEYWESDRIAISEQDIMEYINLEQSQFQISWCRTYVCSVTDPIQCNFSYSRVRYSIDGVKYPCYREYHTLYFIGHGADTVADAERVVDVIDSSSYSHEYINGQCECGARHITQYRTYDVNGYIFSELVLDRYENTDPENPGWYQWEYEYFFEPFCVRKSIYTSSDDPKGYSDYFESCSFWAYYDYSYIKGPTCTQDGVGYRVCELCGSSNTVHFEPTRHNWLYNSNKQLYVCSGCGLENINGSSGKIVLEDCTEDGSDILTVGYYLYYYDIEYTYNVTLILKEVTEGQDNEIYIQGVTFTEATEGRYVMFSRSEVESLASALGYEPSEYNIRLSFVPSNYDDNLDYAITFE